MEVFGWLVAGALALVVAFLTFRSKPNPYPEAVARLASELDRSGTVQEAQPGDPPEVSRLRAAIPTGRRVDSGPAGSGDAEVDPEDPQEKALHGLFRYLDSAVLRPLEEALSRDLSSLEVRNAVDALQDLGFYAEGVATGPRRRENLQSVLQSVTREFALDTGTPVKFSGPDTPIPVSLAAEPFKDALFLLLANAERFGGGGTIEVVVEQGGEEVEVQIRDRGPGFTEEALKRAFEPFWTS
ncbi:MAG: HAMP domain-containing sensor histidine kinase, partial [Gemmatimonadota bacterium]